MQIEKIKPGVLKAMLTANEVDRRALIRCLIDATVKQEELTSEEQSYKPLARNPLYCGAQYSSLWEMQKVSGYCLHGFFDFFFGVAIISFSPFR